MANKKWSDMTRAEKRVALAKDVIKQLDTGMLKSLTGDYVNTGVNSLNKHLKDGPVELQKILPEIKCKVCAKGALFLCDILKRNEFKISNKYDLQLVMDDDIKIRLKGVFTERQLDLIESAFERMRMGYFLFEEEDNAIGVKAVNFGSNYANDNKRLIAIMNNIIENKGIFKP